MHQDGLGQGVVYIPESVILLAETIALVQRKTNVGLELPMLFLAHGPVVAFANHSIKDQIVASTMELARIAACTARCQISVSLVSGMHIMLMMNANVTVGGPVRCVKYT